VRKWLRQNSALFRFVKFAHKQLRRPSEEIVNTEAPGFPYEYMVFTPPKDEWVDAWAATETALKRLKADVGDAKIYAFWVPDTLEVADDPVLLIRDAFNSELPQGFNAQMPHDLFEGVAANTGIQTIDLMSAFLAYKDTNDLGYPYFARTCENHWSPLGHDLAAQTVAAFLTTHGLQ
jgi:hypothetical protein